MPPILSPELRKLPLRLELHLTLFRLIGSVDFKENHLQIPLDRGQGARRVQKQLLTGRICPRSQFLVLIRDALHEYDKGFSSSRSEGRSREANARQLSFQVTSKSTEDKSVLSGHLPGRADAPLLPCLVLKHPRRRMEDPCSAPGRSLPSPPSFINTVDGTPSSQLRVD